MVVVVRDRGVVMVVAVSVIVMMMGVLAVPGGHRRRGALVNTKLGRRHAGPAARDPRDTEPYSIARLPSAARRPSIGSPKSSNAPRTMSPEAPEKQSK